ncbi:unnamed protein product [Cochlearia groenlandica]
MQSEVTTDLLPSGVSDSIDADAEISDAFSPLNTSLSHIADQASLLRRAKMYQCYMKSLPIPTNRGSLIPFTSWFGLSLSMKQLYGQPLHYLTNVLLQRWDQSRLGSDSEEQDLDSIIHPCKAEATVWLVEEIHRMTSSHHHIALQWKTDPMYHSFIDQI